MSLQMFIIAGLSYGALAGSVLLVTTSFVFGVPIAVVALSPAIGGLAGGYVGYRLHSKDNTPL